ncbi:MAG: PAS domain S-box protein, partial [Chloroflexi bacterium]|nr:PAS domain S-box protein [Chloroflexota bacterium]
DAGISIIAAVRDVTERTKAEAALRESESRFSTAFHDNPVPVAITRARDGKLIDVNDAFLSITGYRRAELIGRTLIELGVLIELGPREAVAKAILEQGTIRDIPAQIKTKTGALLDVLGTVTQIEIEGEPCFLIAAVDITERKRLAEELEKIHDDLESKLERRMEGDNPYKLTFREFTVLHLIAAGKADKQIANDLGISIYTVHRHVSKILAKMESPSRTEAGTRALREGLLE